MIPMIALAAATTTALFLLKADSLAAASPESSPPEPSPNPPSIPPSQGPAGLASKLFRRSPAEIASELQTLFSQAYEADHEQRAMKVKNPSAEHRLQERVREIEELCRREPVLSKKYDRPEIVRYYYWSDKRLSPELRYFVFQYHDSKEL